jgi:purine-binding chemotaxis protein CheW
MPLRTLVVCRLAAGRFALVADAVDEIARAVLITPLPSAPAVVEGIVNHRGRLVPVLDLRQRFRLPAVPLHAAEHLVLARAGARPVAMRVDHVEEILAIDDALIAGLGDVVPEERQVAGVARLPDGLLVIHDLERFLSSEEALALDASLAELRA